VVNGPSVGLNPPGRRLGRSLYRPEAVERKTGVAATKTLGGTSSGRSSVDEEARDPMKFMNGDDSLSDIASKLEASGKRITLPNKEMFIEAISNANWN